MGRYSITGLVCLGTSLVLLAFTRGLPEATLLVPVGPGFYPRIILGIAAALSALVIFVDWRVARSGRAAAAQEAPNRVLVLLSFAIIGLYIGLLPYFGFRLATLLFVAALQATLEAPRGARAWLVIGVTALVTTLVTYLVFETYLNVLLPRGRWTGF